MNEKGLRFKASTHKDIIQVDVKGDTLRNWEQWVLLTSDRHWDNPKSNTDLQLEHLKKAKDRNAMIIDTGDLFCLMQGKYDPRGSKSSIREEHNVDNYIDSVIDTGVKFFAPYGDNFVMVGVGNHEASVSKRCETDITGRFVEGLKVACPTSTVQAGSIQGFVRLVFSMGKTEQYSYLIDYHHGYGGGGPVTKNVIQASRRAVYSDADIVCQGHTHDAWEFPITKRHVSSKGKIVHRTQWHLQIPSYKNHYNKGKVNWENLKGFPPKPIGCIWLRFFYRNLPQLDGSRSQRRVHFERHLDLIDYE
tara:strand:+ start:10640 stop:11554 length:915 start_codon:yes stop_codon:yes gene_type:complete